MTQILVHGYRIIFGLQRTSRHPPARPDPPNGQRRSAKARNVSQGSAHADVADQPFPAFRTSLTPFPPRARSATVMPGRQTDGSGPEAAGTSASTVTSPGKLPPGPPRKFNPGRVEVMRRMRDRGSRPSEDRQRLRVLSQHRHAGSGAGQNDTVISDRRSCR